MDKFREYEFDVTRLWDVRRARVEAQEPRKLTNRSKRPPREPAAEVVPFPAHLEESPHDIKGCRRRVRAELRETAMSLKLRDMMRRNGIADRCAACGRCPDITD